MQKAWSGWQTLPGHGSVPGMATSPDPCRGCRFPAEVIWHAAWLHHCFGVRGVGTRLASRGVVVSYESIRDLGLRFGRLFANLLKRRMLMPPGNPAPTGLPQPSATILHQHSAGIT